MSFVLTYNTLVQQIMNYLERTDEATQNTIPMFILLAQDRIAKDSKSLGIETYITGTFDSNGGSRGSILTKPNNWKNTISFNCAADVIPPGNHQRIQILSRSYEFCRLYWPDPTQTGSPQYFSDYGYNNWLIAPTPDKNYAFEIAYMAFITPIDDTNQTNWLTQYAPELLFYGCMLESMIYIKNESKIQFWQQFYQDALAKINQEDHDRYTTRYANKEQD